MINTSVFSPKAELLLTSSGSTTDSINERLYAMVRGITPIQDVNVLRLADVWKPFNANDPIDRATRLEHYVESQAARLWSKRYLRWSLGKRATITTVTLGDMGPIQVQSLLNNADLLVVPGGNTYQVIRGIYQYRELIREAISEGLPYVGESAGSIIAGKTIKPASLKPADTCPDINLLEASGLRLIDADIVVHDRATDGAFDIRGPLARITRLALASVASDVSNYNPSENGTHVYALSEGQALSVSGSEIQLI